VWGVKHMMSMMGIRGVGSTTTLINKVGVPSISLIFRRLLSYSGKEFNDQFKQHAPVILMSHEQHKQSFNVNDTFSTSEYAITTKADVINGYNFIEHRYGVRSFVADVTIPDSATLERYGNNVVFNSNSFRVQNNRTFWNTNMGKEIINHRLNNDDAISKTLIEQYIQQTGKTQTVNIVPMIKTLLDHRLVGTVVELVERNKNTMSLNDMSAILDYESSIRKRESDEKYIRDLKLINLLLMVAFVSRH